MADTGMNTCAVVIAWDPTPGCVASDAHGRGPCAAVDSRSTGRLAAAQSRQASARFAVPLIRSTLSQTTRIVEEFSLLLTRDCST